MRVLARWPSTIFYTNLIRKNINQMLLGWKISLSRKSHNFISFTSLTKSPKQKPHTHENQLLKPKKRHLCDMNDSIARNHCLLFHTTTTALYAEKFTEWNVWNVIAFVKRKNFRRSYTHTHTFFFVYVGQNANFSRYQKLLAFFLLLLLLLLPFLFVIGSPVKSI